MNTEFIGPGIQKDALAKLVRKEIFTLNFEEDIEVALFIIKEWETIKEIMGEK